MLECAHIFVDGTFTGITNETSGIINFRGIRYAEPPVGGLRWRPPVSPPTTYLGNVNASNVDFQFLFVLLWLSGTL